MTEFYHHFGDRSDPRERAKILRFTVFEKDLFGRGIMNKEDIRGEILDLGCGKGALGGLLKEINPEIRIIGVDLIRYEGVNLLDKYEKVIKQDAVEALGNLIKQGEKFDLIISLGMPPEVIRKVLENKDSLIGLLNPVGKVLLMYDIDVGDDEVLANEYGFEYFEGEGIVDRHILILRPSTS